MTLRTKLKNIRKKIKNKRNFPNEFSISQGIVLPILQELNWNIFDTKVVRPEYLVSGSVKNKSKTQKNWADFALFSNSGSPKVFVEVEGLGGVTEDAVYRAIRYAYRVRVRIVVLTDGRTWSFYLPLEEGSYEERWVDEIDILKDSPRESFEVLQRYLDKSRVVWGKAYKSALGDLEDRRYAV